MTMLALAALLCFAMPAHAVPSTIAQEGVLLSADGNPVNGAVQMRFSIYVALAGGQAIWFEDHDVNLVEGYYAVYLGGRAPILPAFAPGQERFIGFAINGAAELRPRLSLGSVPFAMVSDNVTGDITPRSVQIAAGGNLRIGGSVVIDSQLRWQGAPIDGANVVGQVGDASTFDGHGIDEFIVITSNTAPQQLADLIARIPVLDADTLGGQPVGRFLGYTSAQHQAAANAPRQVLDWINGIPAGNDPVPGLNADRLDGLDSSRFLRFDPNVANASAQVLAWLNASGDPVAINATRLDGLDSTQFVRAGSAIDAATLDGIDSTGFLGASAKARDSDSLDGLDSLAFVRAGAVNADRLDGIDSTQFMRADGNTGTTGNLAVAGTSSLGQVRVSAGSRVGVGVADPLFEVHVNGTIKANRLIIDSMLFNPLAQAPANPVAGMVYFHQPTATFRGFDGNAWAPFNQPAGGSSPQNPGLSCQDILDRGASRGSGQYWIRPGNPAAVEVYCDMVTDGGGYTQVRFNDGSLAGDQNSYRNKCSASGMEIIVPRTRPHALAIRAWNSGETPNLVNVYPKNNGARGLENWSGRCRGQSCSFWMSDLRHEGLLSAQCSHLDPNGDNNVNDSIYRWNSCNDQPFGGWNDGNNGVDIRGWVICSTNDKTFPIDGTSCENVRALGRSRGNGSYQIKPAGAPDAVTVYCDMTTDGGGYTMVRFDDPGLGGDQNQYRNKCTANGMEVIVPRTRAHALAIKAWNNGEPPNLVNVFPRANGSAGLENWTGRCRGQACGFWMSDLSQGGLISANCDWLEPNGDNNTNDSIYRWDRCNGEPFGGWNDGNNAVDIRGWVVCSTNDR